MLPGLVEANFGNWEQLVEKRLRFLGFLQLMFAHRFALHPSLELVCLQRVSKRLACIRSCDLHSESFAQQNR